MRPSSWKIIAMFGLLLTPMALAQSSKCGLSLNIVDYYGNPLDSAVIEINALPKSNSKETKTIFGGKPEIQLTCGSYNIKVSAVGHRSREVDLLVDQLRKATIALPHNVYYKLQLPSVSISISQVNPAAKGVTAVFLTHAYGAIGRGEILYSSNSVYFDFVECGEYIVALKGDDIFWSYKLKIDNEDRSFSLTVGDGVKLDIKLKAGDR